MTEQRWVRLIDTIDLMVKSGWDLEEAKSNLADALAHGAADWIAESAMYMNPDTSKLEKITMEYKRSLRDSPGGIAFSTIRDNPNGLKEKRKIGRVNVYLADWQDSLFRCAYTQIGSEKNDSFYSIFGLYISRKYVMSKLTVDIMHRYSHVLAFDPSTLDSAWGGGGAFSKPPPQSATEGIRRRVKPGDLESWWNNLGEARSAMSLDAIWNRAGLAFPDKVVTRQAIRELAGERKRGRKPIGHE